MRSLVRSFGTLHSLPMKGEAWTQVLCSRIKRTGFLKTSQLEETSDNQSSSKGAGVTSYGTCKCFCDDAMFGHLPATKQLNPERKVCLEVV